MGRNGLNIALAGWNPPGVIEGGLDTHVHNLAMALAEEGARVFLLANTTQDKKEKIYESESGGFVVLEPVPTKRDFASMDSTIKTVEKYNKKMALVVSELKRKNPGSWVFHGHDWLSVEAGLYLKKKRGIPFVLTIHSLDYMRSAITPLECEGWKTREIEHEGLVNADAIITVSNLMADEISRSHGIPRDRIVVAHNSTLPEIQPPEKKNHKENGKKRILYLGRLSVQKGVEHLILASWILNRKRGDIELVLAGDGEHKEKLSILAKTVGMTENTRFLGFVTEEEKQALLRESHVFVAPSVYEPFGIAVVEAARHGLPVVTTSSCGATELLQEYEGLFLVKPRDSLSLALAIDEALDMGPGRDTSGILDYSWRDHAKTVLQEYERVLKK